MPDDAPRFLVVEDDAVTRTMIKGMLRKMGFEDCDVAVDGAMALNMLKSEHYDIVISDWHMPNVTGLDLVRAVRKEPELENTYILMLTAEADKAQVINAVKAGVNGYILKPFAFGILEDKIREAVGGLPKDDE